MTDKRIPPGGAKVSRGAQDDLRKSIELMLSSEHGTDAARRDARARGHRAFAPLPPPESEPREPDGNGNGAERGRLHSMLVWIVPGVRQLALVAVLVLCLLYPWMAIGTFLVTLWVVLGAHLLVGLYRMSGRMLRALLQSEPAHPEEASRMRRGARRVTDQADRLLSRLPDRWTEGIGRLQRAGEDTPDGGQGAFGRLAEGERRRQARRRREEVRRRQESVAMY